MTAYSGRVLGQAYAWLRGHPQAADGLLGVLLLAASVGQLPHDPAYAAGALGVNGLLAVTVAARRLDPVTAFYSAVLVAAVQLAWGVGHSGSPVLAPTVTDAAVLVLLYTVAAYQRRRISLVGLAVCLAGAGVAITRYAPLHQVGAGPILALAGIAVGLSLVSAWLLGDSAGYRRAYYASLEQRLAAAERARELAERARELEERRRRAVNASTATLRRIERDLHDGAQVRLVALAMALGEIKENLEQAGGDPGTLRLLRAAHHSAKETLAELRDLARGIHPPVLDRGLEAALSALAESSAIPVRLTVEVSERPSAAIEAIAYFCTAELLANAAKHAKAKGIEIHLGGQAAGRGQADGLLLTVTDDGNGGARITPGGGLAGLRERVQTVDGWLDVTSPPDGPTAITIGLPRHA